MKHIPFFLEYIRQITTITSSFKPKTSVLSKKDADGVHTLASQYYINEIVMGSLIYSYTQAKLRILQLIDIYPKIS